MADIKNKITELALSTAEQHAVDIVDIELAEVRESRS